MKWGRVVHRVGGKGQGGGGYYQGTNISSSIIGKDNSQGYYHQDEEWYEYRLIHT